MSKSANLALPRKALLSVLFRGWRDRRGTAATPRTARLRQDAGLPEIRIRLRPSTIDPVAAAFRGHW